MSKKIKIFAIVILGLALIIWAMSNFGGSADAPTTNPSSPLSTSATAPAVNRAATATDTKPGDFQTILSTVKSITIDTSIFSNPAYRALRDHPVTLGTDIVGRSNPFAPIGTDSAVVGLDQPTVQTLQPGKVTSTSAEFTAQVTLPTTAPVTVVFQYGTTDAFGSATTPQNVTKTGTSFATVTGLTPNTTYKVQAVIVQGSNTISGNTMTFSTTAATPRR